MLPANQIVSILPAPIADHGPKYFTRREINKILSYHLKLKKPVIYLFITYLWRTRARVSEALATTVADIDFDHSTVRIRTLRRRDGHIRSIPIRSDFTCLLANWIDTNKLAPNDRLFNITRKTAYNWVVEACKKAALDDGRAHPKSIRHSFAINLLSQGLPVTALQEPLGHADLSKTLAYTKVLNADKSTILHRILF